MALFRRHTEEPTQNEKLEAEIFEFPFSVLWQDEEPSNLIQYILPVIQIVLTIWIIFKIK